MPQNFLIHGGTVAVVDWAIPCRGADRLDTALMIVCLIRAAILRPKQHNGRSG
ncbi:hypothetical protein [Actinoplanes regularis]|uniref:hypothetical protein n=1 Tax=Actinoplanes regularis TaxID=52697 RepID=UPI0025555E27|nr:hypothetical protein [Actinoplanes regularis]